MRRWYISERRHPVRTHYWREDHPSFFRAMGLPIHFDNLRIREADGEAKYHESAYITAGQRVAPVG